MRDYHQMLNRTIIAAFLVLFILSCKNVGDKNDSDARPNVDALVELNKYFIQKDKERIQNYIERKNLKMSESPTGLWYQIVKPGVGSDFTDADRITMEFDCSLLDGTMCYSSEILGPKELVVGRSSMEPGLNEGLRMLKPGAKAIFILPPYMAFGFPGDGKKIPSRAVLVYNVTILQPQ